MALSVSTDPEHKFTLSIQLNKLDIAFGIAKELDDISSWKKLSDEALSNWKVIQIYAQRRKFLIFFFFF